MLVIIEAWLIEHGIASNYLTFATLTLGSVIILVLCAMSFYLTRHQLLVRVEKVVQKSRNTWDNVLAENHVFVRISYLYFSR